jgi:hypothetical protein
MTAAVLLMTVAACGRDNTPPSTPEAPPGAEKEADTKILEKGAESVQDLSPIRAVDHYLEVSTS